MSDVSLFPEWERQNPPPVRKPVRPWTVRPTHRRVLTLLARGHRDDRQLVDALVGDMKPSTVLRLVDELAAHGLIVDTGERVTDRRINGRACFVWAITQAGRRA